MGTLLDFANAPRSMSRRKMPARVGSPSLSQRPAEVIFFPGVRYEREALELAARIGTIGSGGPLVPKEPGKA